MKSSNARNLMYQIDAALRDINSFVLASPAEQSYLAKFLVVFIAGIYEECIETIIREMVGALGSPQMSSFVDSYLKTGFRNPSMENLNSLLKKFDSSWPAKLKSSISLDQQDALNSIYINKNALAHGAPVTITLTDVIAFYSDSRVVIEEVDNLLL